MQIAELRHVHAGTLAELGWQSLQTVNMLDTSGKGFGIARCAQQRIAVLVVLQRSWAQVQLLLLAVKLQCV